MAIKHLIVAALLYPSAVYAGSCTDPGNFVAKQRIETKFSDFLPGQRAVYSDGEAQAVVTVQPHFVKSGGIWWRVITDIGGDLATGLLGESTVDLYAENKQGDVCYGGEITDAWEYSSADNLIAVADDGSFVHNLDGDRAGLYMPANPTLNQEWTIERLDGGATREVVRVTAVTATRVTLRITHYEDGELTEVETKVFDARGELSASVPGEPTSTRRSISS